MAGQKRNGSNSREVEPAKTLTEHARDFIANCTKVKRATGVFCLRKMTDWQEGALVAAQTTLGGVLLIQLAQVAVGWRAML